MSMPWGKCKKCGKGWFGWALLCSEHFCECGGEIEVMVCRWCKKDIVEGEFKDKESYEEFLISGLCAKCQDEIFEDDGR